jgi:hypothetical protein
MLIVQPKKEGMSRGVPIGRPCLPSQSVVTDFLNVEHESSPVSVPKTSAIVYEIEANRLVPL